MTAGIARPGHSTGYLNHQPNLNDQTERVIAARDGSARLLAALLRYYERRRAA